MTFDVPVTAALGETYSRFRCNTAGGVGPTGQADDGEIEDYVVTIDSQADLLLTKVADTETVVLGSSFDYLMTVTNNGPSPALDVVITDNLPAGLELVSTAGCAEDPVGVSTCSLGTIDPGEQMQVTLTVLPQSGVDNPIVNTANVTSSTSDPEPDNDDDTAEGVVLVIPVPTLNTVALILMFIMLLVFGAIRLRLQV